MKKEKLLKKKKKKKKKKRELEEQKNKGTMMESIACSFANRVFTTFVIIPIIGRMMFVCVQLRANSQRQSGRPGHGHGRRPS